MSADIHENKKRLQKTMENIEEASPKRISNSDKELLRDFYNYCYSTNLSDTRVYRYMITLWKITEWKSKDFDQMSRGKIQNLVSKINQKEYSPHTKKDYRITLKKFFQWLDGDPDTKEYPDKVKWIKTTLEYNGKKLPEEILNKEEVKRLIRTANNTRDKAFISTLYESGCRIGELLPIKWKHLDFTPEEGVKLTVNGKTGYRKILLVSSKSLLSKWKAGFPKDKVEEEDYVWINTTNKKKDFGNQLRYRSISRMLKKVAEKAGVEKDVNPHAFRHARATHLANHFTEAQMCEYFGWVQGSKQPATYVHLSGRDINKAVKRLHGLEEREEEVDKFDIRKCPNCGKENGPEANVCEKCGYKFGESMEDRLMDKIMEDPKKWGDVFLEAVKNAKSGNHTSGSQN